MQLKYSRKHSEFENIWKITEEFERVFLGPK